MSELPRINLKEIYGDSADEPFDADQRRLDRERFEDIKDRQAKEPKYPLDRFGFTKAEIKAQEAAAIGPVSTGRHSRFGSEAVRVDREYQGSLGGGTPQNPLRIGGVVHQ